jgi:hypothetical protein
MGTVDFQKNLYYNIIMKNEREKENKIMEDKKLTKKDYYNEILSILTEKDESQELIDFVQNQIDTLDKRAEKAKERAAEKRAEGDELRETVKSVLTNDFQTVENIVSAINDEEVSKAKVIARLTQLVTLGEVEKTDVKSDDGKTRKAYRLA